MNKEELFALMEQIAEEREAARPVVEQLVESGEAMEDIEIPEGWRTAGMVLELCEKAYGLNELAPAMSLHLAQVGLMIATQTDDRWLSMYLRGRTWNEVGYANRYLGTRPAAISAFHKAEEWFSSAGLRYEAGVAIFLRAGQLYVERRYEEALTLNRHSRRIFEEANDTRRLASCDVLEGTIAFVVGDLQLALAKLPNACSTLIEVGDLHNGGIASTNLGYLYGLLGRRADAIDALNRARQIFVQLDLPAEINRVDWNIAELMLESAEFESALGILGRIRSDYHDRRMTADAAEVGLCMVDALVALRRFTDAQQLTESILAEFGEVCAGSGAQSALAYLREILGSSSNPLPGVRHVRQLIRELRDEPVLVLEPFDDSTS